MERRNIEKIKGRVLAMFDRLEKAGANMERERELVCGPVKYPRFTGPLSCNKILQEATCISESFAGARFWEQKWSSLSQTLLKQTERRLWALHQMLENGKAFSRIVRSAG